MYSSSVPLLMVSKLGEVVSHECGEKYCLELQRRVRSGEICYVVVCRWNPMELAIKIGEMYQPVMGVSPELNDVALFLAREFYSLCSRSMDLRICEERVWAELWMEFFRSSGLEKGLD